MGKIRTGQDGDGLEVGRATLLQGDGDGAAGAAGPPDGGRLASLDGARRSGEGEDALRDGRGRERGNGENLGEQHLGDRWRYAAECVN